MGAIGAVSAMNGAMFVTPPLPVARSFGGQKKMLYPSIAGIIEKKLKSYHTNLNSLYVWVMSVLVWLYG